MNDSERPVVGEQVFVRFNGHLYVGTVQQRSRTRDLVRFTTGSGRTRDRWFRSNPESRVGLRLTPEAN